MACDYLKWRKKYLLGYAFLAYCFNVSLPAQSSPTQPAEFFSLSLEELLDVKVSGVTQVESEILWSPASINLFDKRSFRLLNIDSLHQLTPLAPGFHVARADDDNNPSIAVRGRRIGSSGREVLLLLDGMRIDNWYSGGGTFTVPDISLFGLQKVEFIRGAVSQLYGSNAFTGVINLVSDPTLNETKFTLGQNNLYRVQSNIAGELSGVQQKLFMDLKKDGGASYDIPQPGTGENVTLRDGSEGAVGHYQVHISDWSGHALFSHFTNDKYYVAGDFSPEFSGSERTFYNLSLKHEKQWTASYRSHIQGGYRYFDYQINGEFAPSGALFPISEPPSSLPLWVELRNNQEHEIWLHWKNYFQWGNWVTTLLGLEFRDIDRSAALASGNYDLGALSRAEYPIASSDDLSIVTTAVGEADDQLLGAYLQTILSLGAYDQITLGLRQDESDVSGGRTSPRIAWVHKFRESFSVKAIYGEAFRVPVANELYLENNPVLLGNPNLKAETVKTSELIAFFENSRVRFQLGYFDSRYNNAISQVAVDGLRQFANVEASRSAGVEGNMSYEFHENWIGRVNFSHLTRKPDDQYRMPDDLAGLILTHQQKYWHWSYYANYVSERDSNPPGSDQPIKLQSYWLHNLSAGLQLSKPYLINLAVDNLTNTEYFEASMGDNLNVIPSRGRALRLEFVLTY